MYVIGMRRTTLLQRERGRAFVGAPAVVSAIMDSQHEALTVTHWTSPIYVTQRSTAPVARLPHTTEWSSTPAGQAQGQNRWLHRAPPSGRFVSLFACAGRRLESRRPGVGFGRSSGSGEWQSMNRRRFGEDPDLTVDPDFVSTCAAHSAPARSIYKAGAQCDRDRMRAVVDA
jgi:hypothetical protein